MTAYTTYSFDVPTDLLADVQVQALRHGHDLEEKLVRALVSYVERWSTVPSLADRKKAP